MPRAHVCDWQGACPQPGHPKKGLHNRADVRNLTRPHLGHRRAAAAVRARAPHVRGGLEAAHGGHGGRRRLPVRVLRPLLHRAGHRHATRVAQHHHQPRAQELRAPPLCQHLAICKAHADGRASGGKAALLDINSHGATGAIVCMAAAFLHAWHAHSSCRHVINQGAPVCSS